MDLTTSFTLPWRTANELALAAVLAPLAITGLRVPVASKIWALDASPTKGAYVSTPGTSPAWVTTSRTASSLWSTT